MDPISMAGTNRQKRQKDNCGRVILTPRQVQILRLIRSYQDRHGCSPTLREMAKRLGLSKVTVFEHVESLVAKGLLDRQPGKARSLTLSDQVADFCQPGMPLEEGSEKKCDDHWAEAWQGQEENGLPLLGQISAGFPVEAQTDSDRVDLKVFSDSSGDTYVLEVRGDSMIGEQIRDRDYVVLQRRQPRRDGEIVAALLEDGQTTLKKLYRDKDGYRLEAANPDYQTIHTRDVQVQGVLIGLIRRY